MSYLMLKKSTYLIGNDFGSKIDQDNIPQIGIPKAEFLLIAFRKSVVQEIKMEFKYKPDFNEAPRYWDAFWNKQIIDRPCIVIQASKEGIGQSLKLPCRVGYNSRIDIPYGSGGQLVVHLPLRDGKVRSGQFDLAVKTFEKWARRTFFGGEAIPSFHPTFGPDQFAAFLGAELMQSEEKIGTKLGRSFREQLGESASL